MSRALLSTIVLLPLLAAPATAQGLKWSRDVEAAVQNARRAQSPMMFYLVDRSRRTNDDLRQRQAAVFRDVRVAAAAKGFVCVELPIDQHPELAHRWGLPERSSRYVVYTTPDGDKVHQSGVGSVDGFVRQIRQGRRQFVQHVWDAELLPVFRANKSDQTELLAAVRRVGDLKITEADFYLAQIVEKREISDGLRGQAFRVLGVLSTKLAVETLVDYALADPRAAKALEECDPIGAERMLSFLESGDARLRAIIYNAVTRICNVARPKNEMFWENADERAQADELRRVRDAVRAAAMKQQHEDSD